MGKNIINIIIRDAFEESTNEINKINSELTLHAATLDAAWKKHGIGSTKASHIVFDGMAAEREVREKLEYLLFVEGTDANNGGVEGKWTSAHFSVDENILIAKIALDDIESDFKAVLGAASIDDVAADTVCTVEELGHHPTLCCKGDFVPTSVITAIIELDGSLDADLGDCREQLKGKPVLVTWFPGDALPTSSPVDCQVGDTLTAAEAKAKGWRVVSFKN